MTEPVCRIVPVKFDLAMLRFDSEFLALMRVMKLPELLLMVPCIKQWNIIQGMMAGSDPYSNQAGIDETAASLHAVLSGKTKTNGV